MAPLLYLDQNYLSGFAKRKPAFRELERAIALVYRSLLTCDAFMADVIRRTRLELRHRVELYSGRRADVLRLRDRLSQL